ncbi:MAG: hypothetical protein ACE5KT_02360 [Methanosarcinales archaeon]
MKIVNDLKRKIEDIYEEIINGDPLDYFSLKEASVQIVDWENWKRLDSEKTRKKAGIVFVAFCTEFLYTLENFSSFWDEFWNETSIKPNYWLVKYILRIGFKSAGIELKKSDRGHEYVETLKEETGKYASRRDFYMTFVYWLKEEPKKEVK